MSAFFAILLSLLAVFLILLVLVQRGRGGGLAGALGGMGGSSAFGAKAGDVFTRITIITASIWIACCLIALFWAENRSDALGNSDSSAPASQSSDVTPPFSPPAGSEKSEGKDAATTSEATTTTPGTPSATAPGPELTPPAESASPATESSPPAATSTPPADAEKE
jgi:preprotein translocase subunit SecG